MAMFFMTAELASRIGKGDYAATNNSLSAKSAISERKCFAKLY